MGHKRRQSTTSECGEAVGDGHRRRDMAPTVFTASRLAIGMPLNNPPPYVGTSSSGYCGLQQQQILSTPASRLPPASIHCCACLLGFCPTSNIFLKYGQVYFMSPGHMPIVDQSQIL